MRREGNSLTFYILRDGTLKQKKSPESRKIRIKKSSSFEKQRKSDGHFSRFQFVLFQASKSGRCDWISSSSKTSDLFGLISSSLPRGRRVVLHRDDKSVLIVSRAPPANRLHALVRTKGHRTKIGVKAYI